MFRPIERRDIKFRSPLVAILAFSRPGIASTLDAAQCRPQTLRDEASFADHHPDRANQVDDSHTARATDFTGVTGCTFPEILALVSLKPERGQPDKLSNIQGFKKPPWTTAGTRRQWE